MRWENKNTCRRPIVFTKNCCKQTTLYSSSYCRRRVTFLPCDATHKRGYCPHAVSVSLSVTFVSCVKTNKDIFEFFSPSGSQAILVFPCQTGWRYSDENVLPIPPASNAGGIGRNRDSERISGTYGLSSTASLPRNADWSISRPFPY